MSDIGDEVAEIAKMCNRVAAHRLAVLSPDDPAALGVQMMLSVAISQAMQILHDYVNPESYEEFVNQICVQFKTGMQQLKQQMDNKNE